MKQSLQFGMMESGLFWLELDEDRWCHLLQVISFQLALEALFLVFCSLVGLVGRESKGEVVDEEGNLEAFSFVSKL